MKKILIPATLVAILCGAITGVLIHDPKVEIKPGVAQQPQSPCSFDKVRQPDVYSPSFGAVTIPEEMKQHYTVNPKASQVITGNSGTMLLIPDNAFTDKNGNLVSGKVKLELVEGITHEDIISMNLGTMSAKGMLETGGMIYLGAKSESGEELVLSEGKIIETEIPAMQVKPGMQLWEGQENVDGSITWANPEALNVGLREVPVETLGDSSDNASGVAKDDMGGGVVGRIVWWDWSRQTVIRPWGAATKDTVIRWQNDTVFIPGFTANENVVATVDAQGLDVVNFADKKFEHTNISTAEFRSRLPYIRQACDARIAHCYADHPNRALWKSDAAAADSLEKSGCPLAELFGQFALMKQEKIDPKDPNTAAALDAARGKAIANYSKRMADQQAAYASYSFGMRKLGWANIDRLCGTGTRMMFNARIDALATGENPTVSLLIPGRGIFLPGYKRPNGDYSFTHGENEQEMEYPKGEEAFILARTGEGDNLKYGLKEVVLGTNSIESLSMKQGTEAQLAKEMGNLPPEKKESGVRIIDDWFTRSITNGTGCLCFSEPVK